MSKLTWIEVKNAVNKIYERHNPLIKEKNIDYVKDICNNALPHAMIQVLAMDCAVDIRDEYTLIVIDGYKQLNEKGFIGDMEDY